MDINWNNFIRSLFIFLVFRIQFCEKSCIPAIIEDERVYQKLQAQELEQCNFNQNGTNFLITYFQL